ncbi:helix-turn-helix domain-containing protein [Lipingzhangella sp. LS1_29]|uniref:Helix-turn-helix domain-containing protein n=2 Tax=Lipingzhangella rawalii TaxID=2055835 RepID=A0ABU2HC54_9ACTN|nr:helix-turn-helix domain-containing protein [Lipingzhangella rawalii]
MSIVVKQRYFELLREGLKGAAAAREVGVSASCGSNWFIEAGSMIVPDPGPVSPRFLTQDDRIAIADGLQAQQPVTELAAAIGKSASTVYREIQRGKKPDYGPHRDHRPEHGLHWFGAVADDDTGTPFDLRCCTTTGLLQNPHPASASTV